MLRTFRWLHKWVGLLLGLQFALWAISGAMMALIDHHDVMGEQTRRKVAPLVLPAVAPALTLKQVQERFGYVEVSSLRLRPLLDRYVYEATTPRGVRLVAADDGAHITINEAMARQLAQQEYSGQAEIKEVERLSEPNIEARKHEGPMWRVAFADEENTTLYVSAETGRVLERRNDSWRLFDFFWMLHIMDYSERESFNHPLIILAAIAALWLSASGLFLIFDSFSANDFNLVMALRRLRGHGVPVSLRTPGGATRSLALPEGLTLFDALGGAGVLLPSNCGGGGSCGLCKVSLGTAAPVTDADRQHIPRRELDQGYRLACRHPVAPSSEVVVPDEALNSRGHTAKVVGVRYISPLIKEVRLRVGDGQPLSYRAGQFIQLEVPAYSVSHQQFGVPDHWQDAWHRLGVPDAHAHTGGIRRSYSMATHPAEAPHEIVLNVRFMPSSNPAEIPCGAGSSYVFGLQPGEQVRFFGPFGTFAATDTNREIVAIGGGAGMAPLRAIIRDELLRKGSTRRISYWYGARSCRDILYREEFEQLQLAHPKFSWNVALSEPDASDAWSGHTGLIHEVVRAQYLSRHRDLKSCEFLVCGPPAMLKATLEMLRKLGVPKERIAYDDFGC